MFKKRVENRNFAKFPRNDPSFAIVSLKSKNPNFSSKSQRGSANISSLRASKRMPLLRGKFFVPK